ncbi:hypothetical protein [Siccirubricoccus sp. G192]|uniref:hypothetical protein n=1 Tax=Siccirubricoccus sp. G192 TaxID=2849651 RepID=UPI0020C2E65A|nr:hypothetical protein [Siccirubricoccus sp. G192]
MRMLEARRGGRTGHLLDLALPLAGAVLAAPRPPPRTGREARRTDRVARHLHGGAAILALAVLADSGLEHYRAMFFNRAMYVPLAASSLTLAASLHGLLDERPLPHAARDAVYGLAAATGLVGNGFHLWNIGKRPGGFSWLNLFYGAPVGAPMALLLAGAVGLAAERVREDAAARRPRILGQPAGRLLAGLAATGLAGTSAEAALFHFRGAYHDPFMFVPVALPPVAAALLARAAAEPGRRRPRRLARWWLRLTALLGFAGVGFHAFGIHRNMGGWRNWSQNILNGPPLPAPPSFTGLALAGLAALRLLEEEGRDG